MTETNTDALMEILPDLLAPLLMAGSVTDPARARRAAEQAIGQYRTEYQAGTQGELVTISQIVAFALTAIDNLRLSMPDAVSMTMKLRLRGNANTLNRASLRAVEALDKARAAAEPLWAEIPDPIETPAPEPVAATLPSEVQSRHQWASAMATVAGELQARSATLPRARRGSDQIWIDVLSSVAGDLRKQPTHAGLSKTDLFRTTLMAGGGFPAHLMAQTPSRTAGK
jgi:hypothetical protein